MLVQITLNLFHFAIQSILHAQRVQSTILSFFSNGKLLAIQNKTSENPSKNQRKPKKSSDDKLPLLSTASILTYSISAYYDVATTNEIGRKTLPGKVCHALAPHTPPPTHTYTHTIFHSNTTLSPSLTHTHTPNELTKELCTSVHFRSRRFRRVLKFHLG